MSGVRVGSRLQQLYALRQRIDHEIQQEKTRTPPTPPHPTPTPDKTTARLTQLGVTPRHIKQWAVDHGLIPAVVRGRVPAHLIDTYEQHQHWDGGTL